MGTKENDVRLSGGVFFSLLLRARKQRTAVRGNDLTSSDGLTQTDALRDLIRVFYPGYKEPSKGTTFKQNVSQYKTCVLSCNTYLPFDREEIIITFRDKLENCYLDPLMLMDRFVEKYLDVDYAMDDLISTIINVIESDDGIPDDAAFYIWAYKDPVKKKELIHEKKICVPSFLLGVWGYIITNQLDNSRGSKTIDLWVDCDASGKKGKLKSGVLAGKKRCLTYDVYFNYQANTGRTNGLGKQYDDIEITVDYSEYLRKTKEKYGQMKTLLYNDQPKSFDDFYVCNNLGKKERVPDKKYYRTVIIKDFSIDQIYRKYGFIIITGTGGLGKSMMMRHLLLDTIDKFEKRHVIPIYVTLKDYSKDVEDLFEYIYGKIKTLGGNISESDFVQALAAGQCLLLLDGLDEINTDLRACFENDLEIFTDKYVENTYVISSRPYSQFVSFSRFKIFELLPFTKEQAISLIDKLDFRADEPSIKANFRKELSNTLYDTHREFTTNPLLLTIMLMTYEQFAEIPSKMHVFYNEAYLALSQKHDASKGAYKRQFATGLSADRFACYFEEFCARTYTDEKFEMSIQEISNYFDALKERKRYECEKNITVTDFVEDLTNNMCLMYYENSCYHFTHRSFQEYFCASYFSKQKDKTLGKVGTYFENKKGRMATDKTFAMLYDMIPDKVEEYIFIPYIENLLEKCDSGRGYWDFLCEVYPTISYFSGDCVDDEEAMNYPNSFIYKFLAKEFKFGEHIDPLCLEYYDDLVYKEFAMILDGDNDVDIVDIDELSDEYIAENGKPIAEGYALSFDVDTILEEEEYYHELLSQLNDDGFPMKKEYYAIRKLLDILRERQIYTGSNLFELF